ncbi:hypothetical protein [Cryptosporidium parvum Iowa II]|uniref:BRCT domain-containing protein n=2 Tax=Cryptosporidium parvum TaxID=5807 RepID=Q5CU32_CRYPI|nr:hypothetical protein [Cryptosporidium parvum Iowa II]EAK88887.1 hypothetical protein cgd2_500 [Cryptosporidium parvum Iowa II]QOY43185.1 BRCT domain containing protein [Cryptosporidium parvum]WKS76343.1 hypothetical protein CPCDC_2g500 [Cryptosporidium sp. 43IA8]|eukprot:QOY43185.1 hypothetical protein CPATCC_000902 [Cryptosporidium parvum]
MNSEIWNNKRFLLSGFEENDENNLIRKKYIENNGGTVLELNSEIMDDDVDYLICNYSKGYRYRHTSIDYQKLRTPFWIWLSVNDEWNYSLEWHPFFRPNGNFKYNILKGFQIYIIGYSKTIGGFNNREKSPKYIRKKDDIGILVSFVETQMGARVIFDDDNKNENESNDDNDLVKVPLKASVTKLALICNNEEFEGEIIDKVKEKNNIQTIVNLDWLFDCYEEGRIVSYKKYIYNSKREKEKREEEKMRINAGLKKENNSIANVKYKMIISHQVYLKHIEIYNIMIKINNIEYMEVGRPSREIMKFIQNIDGKNGLNFDENTVIVLVFNDPMEEQDFWYDLVNILEESVVFNIKLASKEKKDKILHHFQMMRIINDPEDFINKLIGCEENIIPLISKLGSKVGYSIPSFINELLKSESEFLDTVLKFTDFENITGLSGFVEYSNDNPMDIVNLNRSKAIKRFDSFEKEFSTIKFS